MKKTLTATELARSLSDVLNRVRYGSESFVIERGGQIVCELRPVSYGSSVTGKELMELLRSTPHPGDDYLDVVEAHVRNQLPAESTPWDPEAS